MADESTRSRRNSDERRPRRWPWFLLCIVVVALVVLFVLKVTGGRSETPISAATGLAVPTMAFPSTTDYSIALTDFPGKKLVVYFYEGST